MTKIWQKLAKCYVVSVLSMIIICAQGCGDNMNKDSENSKENTYSEYVELGQYKGISSGQTKKNVTEEAIDKVVNELIDNNGGVFEDASDETVQNGYKAYLKYCQVSKESDLFDEENSFDLEAVIGNEQIPAEFESAILGRKKDDEVAASYQDAIYRLRITNVQKPGDISDEFVKKLEIKDVNTVEELRQNISDYLDETYQEEYERAAKDALMEAVYNNCTFKEMPDEMIEPFKKLLQQKLDLAVENMNEDGQTHNYDEYLSSIYEKDGISTVEEYLDRYGRQNANLYAMCQKIADTEGITAKEREIYSLAAGDWLNVSEDYETLNDYIDDVDMTVYERAALYSAVEDYLFEQAK